MRIVRVLAGGALAGFALVLCGLVAVGIVLAAARWMGGWAGPGAAEAAGIFLTLVFLGAAAALLGWALVRKP